MANYLMRYKGIYRLKAHIDQNTNDFPRDWNGLIDSDDVYIKCALGCQIYHYGHGVLVAYIPSIGRGHNILKALGQRLCNFDITTIGINYKPLYDALLKEGTIRHIMENDEEVEFRFHSKNIELIAEYLRPQTSGAGISPFSTKNLPKSDYIIPADDLAAYKNLTKDIAQEDILIVPQITRRFIKNILSKSKQYRSKDVKVEMRKSMLKGKEFIHYSGMWNEYIKYLKKELSKNGSKNS